MQAPVCLIDNGTDGRMSVQQGALQILEQIQEPVVVVAVVGLYRTGKSYLMNRLAGKQKGQITGGKGSRQTSVCDWWRYVEGCVMKHRFAAQLIVSK